MERVEKKREEESCVDSKDLVAIRLEVRGCKWHRTMFSWSSRWVILLFHEYADLSLQGELE